MHGKYLKLVIMGKMSCGKIWITFGIVANQDHIFGVCKFLRSPSQLWLRHESAFCKDKKPTILYNERVVYERFVSFANVM